MDQSIFYFFFKPKDTHALLHKLSYHAPHRFRGIVKSQILRFYRICNREVDFHEATTTLFKSLKKKKAGILALLSEKGTQRDSLWLSVILLKFRFGESF